MEIHAPTAGLGLATLVMVVGLAAAMWCVYRRIAHRCKKKRRRGVESALPLVSPPWAGMPMYPPYPQLSWGGAGALQGGTPTMQRDGRIVDVTDLAAPSPSAGGGGGSRQDRSRAQGETASTSWADRQ